MRIAVTGGIAEGKSTVMTYLRVLGGATLSADEVAREVFHQSSIQAAIAEIIETPLPVAPNVLRMAIAADPLIRRRVNAAMHGEILNHIKKSSANWIEVPLLFETCLQTEFDRVWVVTCGEEEQRKRLAKRLENELEAVQIIRTQLPTLVKCVFADQVIRTNRTEELVQADVKQALERELRK